MPSSLRLAFLSKKNFGGWGREEVNKKPKKELLKSPLKIGQDHDIIAPMAVRIRLRQVGKKNKRSYWIVATNSRAKRNGRFIEKLGFYDPNFDPPKLKINQEKLEYWLGVGAQPTAVVRKLIKNEKTCSVSS